jgi:hypothetical protein
MPLHCLLQRILNNLLKIKFMKKSFLLPILIITIGLSSCIFEKKKGCTDTSATNYDMDAVKDCGCCSFEKVVFYSRYAGYHVNGVPYPITAYPVKLYVNDVEAGTITAFYPNGPGNTTVPGVVIHNPGNQKKVEWYAKVTFPNGSFLILGSGTFNAGKNPYFIPIY